MQTSARNQFPGRVKSIKHGPVSAEVVLDIGGDELVAVVTDESIARLGLAPGAAAYALIKAPWVIVSTDEGLRTSARNRLVGTVVACREGAVNAEVEIELAGGRRLVAAVTNESLLRLGLAPGRRACALVKASHVVLAVAG